MQANLVGGWKARRGDGESLSEGRVPRVPIFKSGTRGTRPSENLAENCFRREAVKLDGLVPRSLAANQFHLPARAIQFFREQLNQRLVCRRDDEGFSVQ